MSSDDPRDDDFWRRPDEPPLTDEPAGLDEPEPLDDAADATRIHAAAAPAGYDEPPVAPSVDPADPADPAEPAEPVESGESGAPAAPAGPSRLQRLSGTLAVVAALVMAVLLLLNGGFGGAAPVAPPTPTPTITPVTIPDEARTKIFTTETPASGEYRATTLSLDPATTAKTTNPYTVRVETTANVDADAAARFIQGVLDDPRGWAGFGNNNFKLVADPEVAKLTITIASPTTTDALCGAAEKTKKVSSCRAGNAIVINSDRWHYMVPNYNNIDEYRAWIVNHYTGEFLGQRIAFCTRKGEPAPAMAQQDGNLGGCLPNAWPKLK